MWGKRKIFIESDANYEKMASAYQLKMLSILNETLASNGIEKDTRKAVLEDFGFNFGMFHDQEMVSGTQSDSKIGRPEIAFSRNGKLHSGNGNFQFHEYAHANADQSIKASLSQLVNLYYRNNESSK